MIKKILLDEQFFVYDKVKYYYGVDDFLLLFFVIQVYVYIGVFVGWLVDMDFLDDSIFYIVDVIVQFK